MKVIEKPSGDLWQKYSLWRWSIRFSRACNCWGGAVVDIENLKEIYLDGARIFNASAYSGTKFAHSVMFSLSKGLSARIGVV